MSEKIERLTLAKAITRGLEDAMEADRTVVMLGEDIGKLGGVYRVTEGLQARFGDRRVMDSPLGESGIIGTSIGMALREWGTYHRCRHNSGRPSRDGCDGGGCTACAGARRAGNGGV